MRKYETVFISDPDLQDQTRTDLFDKVRSIITKEKGIILNFDEWGNKKLAYEIKKKSRGHYVCVTYAGTGELVTELERNFRLSDSILKFMTIVLSEDLTEQQIEEEIATVKEESAATSAEESSTEAVAEESSETAEEEVVEEDTPEETDQEEAAEPQKETE